MVSEILGYMGTWPMWLQIFVILGFFFVIICLIGAIIYKIVKAEKIKAGPIEIDDEENKKEKVEAPKE